MTDYHQDIDPTESQEWQDAISDVIERDGADRAHTKSGGPFHRHGR